MRGSTKTAPKGKTNEIQAPATHAFVGYRKCGNAGFLEADTGQTRFTDIEDALQLLRAGGTISRIPLDDARATPMCWGCGGCA